MWALSFFLELGTKAMEALLLLCVPLTRKMCLLLCLEFRYLYCWNSDLSLFCAEDILCDLICVICVKHVYQQTVEIFSNCCLNYIVN